MNRANRKNVGLHSLLVCLSVMATLFVQLEPASAATPVNLLPAKTDNTVPGDGPATAHSPQESPDEIKTKLDEVRALRDRMDSAASDANPPEGIKPEELTEQRRLIESLIFYYQEGLNSLTATQAELEKRKAAEAEAREWTSFPEPPPYSMLMLYGLEEEADALRGKQALLESSLVGWQGDAGIPQAEVSQAQAAARLAGDTAERAADPAENASAVWRRDFAQWRVRAAERGAWFKEIQAGLVHAKLAVVQANLALLDKKIALAKPQAQLGKADLDKVREGLKATTRNLEDEQPKAVSENTRWAKEREAAARSLEAMRADPQKSLGDSPASLAEETLEARLRCADTWVAATRQQTETLSNLVVFQARIGEFWGYQDTLLNSRDPNVRQTAFQQLERDFARLQQWGAYSQENLRLAVSEETNQQANLDGIGVDSPLRRYEMQSLDAYRLKRQTAERIRLLSDRTEHLLGRWLDDYHQTAEDRPVAERVEESVLDAVTKGMQIFRVELFTVDDEVDLEGKKVNITRGVTLGTLLIAFTVFAVGFWCAKWLSRRFQRMLVGQFAMGLAQSNVLRRWVLMGLSFILLVFVLTLARIPLAAFAFLGGALAIGVGFGTQTLLKNLICGLMLLVERKIRVGDIVEIDGILGRISEIDIRSSTVLGFDGVETMIPNSAFLENKVANWNYTNSTIRRSVRIKVAYGSPSREVIRLLLDCAVRHGQVLEEPKPYVWLEEFGDSALVFGLYFWLEMGPKVSSLQVMSDLRCMMIDALDKAGIAIPFLLDDLRFAPPRPLPIISVAGKTADSST